MDERLGNPDPLHHPFGKLPQLNGPGIRKPDVRQEGIDPLRELERRLDSLPRGREVVAYCRGPYCVLAPDAVKLLRARGYDATSLGDGVAEWRVRGLPVLSAGQST